MGTKNNPGDPLGHVMCPQCKARRLAVSKVTLPSGGEGLFVAGCRCGVAAVTIDPWRPTDDR